MGDEGKVDGEDREKKRRRTGDLRRVAEMVMVLSAMGRMRAGRDPTEVERAMAAEAREKLAAGVAEGRLRPKDLFSREAVRVVVEDLGLNRTKDPMMGFLPPKMSIAEKILLTKKKMEEAKEFSPHTSMNSSQLLPVGYGAHSNSHDTAVHGTHKFLPDSQNPRSISSGGLQTASPLVHFPGHISAVSSFRQSQFNETQTVAASMKSSTTPVDRDSYLLAMPCAEASHLRLDAQFNVPSHVMQVPATTSADYLPTSTSSTPQSTPSAVTNLGQANKLDHTQVKSDGAYALKVAQSSHQVMGNQQPLASDIHQGAPAMLIGHQSSHGLTFVHGPSLFTNHSDIAKSVQKILQPKVFDHPDWIPPSSDYTNKPINCQICKITIIDVESLLVCDGCEKGTHLKCLQSYNNKGIPKAEWHCPRCLMSSNGKPLPPKYGRVTRSILSSKASSNAAVTPPSEKRAENSDTKTSQQKIIANGNSGLPHSVHTSTTGRSHSYSTPDAKAAGGGENPGFSSPAPGLKSQNEMHTITGRHSNEMEMVMAVAPKIKNECSADIGMKNSGLSAHQVQVSLPELSSSHQKIKSEHSCERLHGSAVETTSQSQLSCELKCNKDTEEAIGEEVSSNQLHEACKMVTDETKEPSEVKEAAQNKAGHDSLLDEFDNLQAARNGKPSTNESSEASETKESSDDRASCDITPDERKNIHATSNGALSIGKCGQSSPPESSIEDWVGDILESTEQKNFYQSCRINGILYKLQDYVLVSSKSCKFFPSKLQSVWEDKKSGSKWALVNSYHFPEDLPEVISQPSTPEKNEVYSSNTEIVILADLICGPCNVLPFDKFREENNRRALLKDEAGSLHPIFMCRWKYDESNGTFQSVVYHELQYLTCPSRPALFS